MMKQIYIRIIYSALFALGFLSSCMDDNPPSAKLNVTLDKEVYNVGEAVTFRFQGNPDNIVFYSGEIGSNYYMKDRLYADNDLLVNFKSWVRFGVIYNNLKLLVSNDFNGKYDTQSVSAATWQDASSLFTFSTKDDQTDSGVVNLKEYAGDDNDALLYIAFRYTDFTEPEKPKQNNWIIRSINVDKVSPEGVSTSVGTMSTMGWNAVDFLSPNTKWAISIPQIQINGGEADENDDWAISKGFNVKGSVPDKGKVLKNISLTMDEHTHIYTKPGTYTAVFDNSSIWHTGSEHSLTEIKVEIR